MKKAFTLIELLVVIVIIGIIASMAFVGLNSIRGKSRDGKRVADIRQWQAALEMYRNDNNVYPTYATSGLPLVGANGVVYMSKIPAAPGTNDGACTAGSDTYTYVQDSAGTSYHLTYCLGGSVQSAGPSNCEAVPGNICSVAAAGGGGGGTQYDTGWMSPVTIANDTSIGSSGWASLIYATSSNNLYSIKTSATPLTTNYLKATNFGNSIPVGATINGIVVDIERYGSDTGGDLASDNVLNIVKADGSIGATSRSIFGTHWLTVEGYVTFGGPSDLWGETWTPADINDVDFGAALSVNLTVGGVMARAYVDHMRIKVYYTN